MENLSKNWFVEGWIDFEYKKYILLAYLQKIKNSFDQVELYPHLSNVIQHYEDLLRYNNQQQNITEYPPIKVGQSCENIIMFAGL